MNNSNSNSNSNNEGKHKRPHALSVTSLPQLILYIIGLVTLLAPYFFISFSIFEYRQSSTNIIISGHKQDVFLSTLAGSRISSSSSSPLSSSQGMKYYMHSLENPPNESPFTIHHTILTRFMVGQAQRSNYELARARYLLFETFCWPTMRYQTSKNFFWLILVDPGLPSSIINDMRTLINDVPTGNAYMVLTNNSSWSADGVGVENVTSYGVGLQTILEEYIDGKLDIVTGNTKFLQQASDRMKQRKPNGTDLLDSSIANNKPIMVIETLLDADDGINNNGVEWIQKVAIDRTKERQRQQGQEQRQPTLPPTLNSTWWFLCGTDHIEWHNRDIYMLTNKKYAEVGLTSGLAGLRQSPYFCTSAGFTRVGITKPSSSTEQELSSSLFKFPKDAYSNHALAFYFPECTTPTADSYSTKFTPVVINNSGNYSHCHRREFPGKIFILKSRTITSDSMDHINPKKADDYRDVAWLNKTDYPLIINATERMWNTLRTEFSINRSRAWETSVYIFNNREIILKQNKDSRCAPGFPCYKEAKKNLIRMNNFWKAEKDGGTKKKSTPTMEVKEKIERLAKGKAKIAEMKKKAAGQTASHSEALAKKNGIQRR